MTKANNNTEEGSADWGDIQKYPPTSKRHNCCGVIETIEHHSHACLCYKCVNSDAIFHTCPKQPMLCALLWANTDTWSKDFFSKITDPAQAPKYAEQTESSRYELPRGIGGKR